MLDLNLLPVPKGLPMINGSCSSPLRCSHLGMCPHWACKVNIRPIPMVHASSSSRMQGQCVRCHRPKSARNGEYGLGYLEPRDREDVSLACHGEAVLEAISDHPVRAMRTESNEATMLCREEVLPLLMFHLGPDSVS